MGTEKSRRERIEELFQRIHQQGRHVDVEELYGYFALKYGVTFKTFWSYLKALEVAHKIEPILPLQEFKNQLRM